MHTNLPLSFLLVCCLLVSSISLKAQSTLNLGDIAFTGYQSDFPDQFSFMLLKPIEAGTSISFTDNGWLAAGDFRLVNGLLPEGILTWTAADDYPCNTQIVIFSEDLLSEDNDGVDAGTVVNPDGNFGLSTSGDQIFAFQGNLPTATNTSGFLAAIQMNGDWDADAVGSSFSAQPAVFTDGVNSISISPERDNAVYSCGAPQLVLAFETPAAVAATLNSVDNWTTTNSANVFAIPPDCSFSICCTVIDTIISIAPSCPGSVDGSLTIESTNCSLMGSYSISGPVAETNSTGIFTNLPEGNYTITVADAIAPPGDCFITDTYLLAASDTVAPVITCPVNVQVECDASTDPALTGMATATDDCSTGIDLTISFTDEDTQGMEDCSQYNYIIYRTWTATDAFNNSSTCVQNIAITDTTPPVITSCLEDQTLTCFEPIPSPITDVASFMAQADVSDNCSTTTNDFTIFSTNNDNGGSTCPGDPRILVRTYNIQDACGNMASCEQTFTYLTSTVGPVITSVLPTCYKYCGSLVNPMETDISYTTDCSFGAVVNIAGPNIIGPENCPGTIYRFTYTVTDDCGRISAPVTREFIIGNNNPTIACMPFNLILECGDPNNQDYIDTHLGLVSANTSCELGYTITHFPENFNLTSCGSATVVTFVATDACGRTATCTTTVAIQDNTAPVFTAIPPSVCDVIECGADASYWFDHWINYMLDGLVAEDNCDANVSITAVSPQLNTICGADGKATSVVTFQAIDNCNNITTITGSFVIENNNPALFIDIPTNALANCGDPIVFGAPTVSEQCQTTTTSSDSVDNSDPCSIKHMRTWTATDLCGGLSTSITQTITEEDTIAPTFTFVPVNGSIDCSDFPPTFGIPTVADNCNGFLLTVNDEYIGNPNGCNVNEDFDYRRVWTATDDCGNSSTAEQSFFVNAQSPPADINGFVKTEMEETVEAVVVTLEGGAAGSSENYTTAEDGMYGFNDLEINQNYTITPYLNEDPLNGVSTYDIVLITKHILNLQPLDSPYKVIAADVNNSGTISTLDLLELRKLILLVNEEFSDNTSWRFVEADFLFPQGDNPFATTFPESTYINGLTAGVEQDYVAVKVGDVNNSVIANSMAPGEERTEVEKLTFVMDDAKLQAGETYDLVLTADNFNNISGYQFTIDFDAAKLAFVDMKTENLPHLSVNNFGWKKIDEGFITTSWNSNEGVNLATEEALFRLTFIAKTEVKISEVINISSDYTRAEGYTNDLLSLGIDFRFNNKVGNVNNEYTLYQNQPNPFKNTTVIGFTLPEATRVTISIYDIAGRILKQVEGAYSKGYNELIIDEKDLQESGVFYYHLVTADFEGIRKMMIVD